MIKKIFFTILVLFFTSSFAYAQDFQFENISDQTLDYNLCWVSHNFKNRIHPACFVGGQLKPGKIRIVKQDYDPGIWETEWWSLPHSLGSKVELVKGIDTTGFDRIVIQCDSK